MFLPAFARKPDDVRGHVEIWPGRSPPVQQAEKEFRRC